MNRQATDQLPFCFDPNTFESLLSAVERDGGGLCFWSTDKALYLYDDVLCSSSEIEAWVDDGSPEDGKPEGVLGVFEQVCTPDQFTAVVDPARIVRAVNNHDALVQALDRLSIAAAQRDSTMGDPMRLLEVRAELSAAAGVARDTLNRVGRDDPALLLPGRNHLLAALERIRDIQANSNSDPDAMGAALDEINNIVCQALGGAEGR